jgi:hypothetical protein
MASALLLSLTVCESPGDFVKREVCGARIWEGLGFCISSVPGDVAAAGLRTTFEEQGLRGQASGMYMVRPLHGLFCILLFFLYYLGLMKLNSTLDPLQNKMRSL